jgi:thioredoxin-related protein
MKSRPTVAALLCALLLAVTLLPAWAAERGRLTGGIRYELPGWFKESFLELADDASEAAEADRHVMLFMHREECPYCAALLEESIAGSDYTPWLRKRFDVIAINVRGGREVVFDEQLTVSEMELARFLEVRQTPAVIFLDGNNNRVLRVDGYKTPADFRRILDYVDTKSYLTMDLASYVAKTAAGPTYTPRPHPAFTDRTDLSDVDGPLMVIFEDAWCGACDLLHDTLLADAEVNDLLDEFTVVRLDGESVAPLVDPSGRATTPRAWSRALGIDTRPALFLFGDGEERVRIEGVLRHFHFTTALRYVAEAKYDDYPTLRDYSIQRREALLQAGITVDLGRQ